MNCSHLLETLPMLGKRGLKSSTNGNIFFASLALEIGKSSTEGAFSLSNYYLRKEGLYLRLSK